MGTDLARTLQRRALEGEDDLVASAAQLQDADGVRQLAQHWAKLCLEASPSQLPQRARAVFASMTRADICLLLMPDCAHFLRFVDREEQVLFAVRVAEFASTSQHLRAPALEVWIAVWPQAEGDEDLVAALEQLVQSTARTSDLAAPALTLLVKSFANATSWAPHCVNAALGAVEASIAPASSPWPLTVAMATAYGYVIQCAATIASCQPLPSALSLVGALASWSDNTDLGRALRAALLGNEAAVRGLVAQSEDTRTTQRIVRALGL
ncbi:unnamed protein product [Symbiodinium sp. CCMP2592]|nr:unnamed protein product [Symbiodinium sp. CCMP2592]